MYKYINTLIQTTLTLTSDEELIYFFGPGDRRKQKNDKNIAGSLDILGC